MATTLPKVRSVLFICDRNVLRSPMAEAIAKQMFGAEVYVDSVGVHEHDGEIDPFVVEILAEEALDASTHRPKSLADLMDTSFDLIVSLSPEAHHQAIELTRTSAAEVEYWNLYDPSLIEGSRETRLAGYRELREALRERIRRRLGG